MGTDAKEQGGWFESPPQPPRFVGQPFQTQGNFQRDRLRDDVQALARQGVFIGTSSWKYAGWRGMLYDESRYVWRGRFAEKRFEKDCLTEYAEVFKAVGVDAPYYTFPTPQYLQSMAAQVPPDFQFGLKVTDEITIKKFPKQPRFGPRAGQPNENYLNAEAFEQGFLEPCRAIRAQVGIIMFEFSRFYPADYAHGRDFIAALDGFLDRLPKGWPYGIELRNHYWLRPQYFDCLARHGVAHVFNSWTEMPPVDEQMVLPASRTNPGLVAARFLLKPGRKYEQAVKAFSPYNETREVNEPARQAGAALIREGKAQPQRKTFIFVNNRLEGNALHTIQAMLASA